VDHTYYAPTGFTVSLRAGYYPAYSQEVAWTRVNPAASALYVDMHLDWSDNTNHSNWHICQFTGTSSRWFTPAVNAVGNRWFAAFASYADFGWYGTGWHHV